MSKFLVIAEKPSVAQSYAKNLSAIKRGRIFRRGELYCQLVPWASEQSMHSRRNMTRNMGNGSLMTFRFSRRGLEVEKFPEIRRNSLMC